MLLFELRFVHVPFSRCEMAVPAAGGVDLSRKFVSETEIEEKRKQRQEEWEKVRKPEDPEKAPEEEYDGRSLFERLQEQKDKKQEEYDEQFKFSKGPFYIMNLFV
uniref:FAM192A/Fyv6 N-terminal domain-containing protein n=1 Tax=Oncorhynchus tshawytscha TaxID=74940 RepID=A0AAZ3QYP7_ONCTS